MYVCVCVCYNYYLCAGDFFCIYIVLFSHLVYDSKPEQRMRDDLQPVQFEKTSS